MLPPRRGFLCFLMMLCSAITLHGQGRIDRRIGLTGSDKGATGKQFWGFDGGKAQDPLYVLFLSPSVAAGDDATSPGLTAGLATDRLVPGAEMVFRIGGRQRYADGAHATSLNAGVELSFGLDEAGNFGLTLGGDYRHTQSGGTDPEASGSLDIRLPFDTLTTVSPNLLRSWNRPAKGAPWSAGNIAGIVVARTIVSRLSAEASYSFENDFTTEDDYSLTLRYILDGQKRMMLSVGAQKDESFLVSLRWKMPRMAGR